MTDELDIIEMTVEIDALQAALEGYVDDHDAPYRGGPTPLFCGCERCIVARPLLRPRAAARGEAEAPRPRAEPGGPGEGR